MFSLSLCEVRLREGRSNLTIMLMDSAFIHFNEPCDSSSTLLRTSFFGASRGKGPYHRYLIGIMGVVSDSSFTGHRSTVVIHLKLHYYVILWQPGPQLASPI